MVLIVNADLFPLRVSLQAKEFWKLGLEITNPERTTNRILVEIDLPKEVTFTRAGYSTRYEKKFEDLRPQKTVSLSLPIFVSRHGMVGVYMGKISVTEHYSEYGYVTTKYNKDFILRIVP